MKKTFTSLKVLFGAVLLGVSSIAMAVDTPVAPGKGTLEAAITAAAAGDVLILTDLGVYEVFTMMTIDKDITIQAVTSEPELPALSGLPVIMNAGGALEILFDLQAGAKLTMKGIDVDNGGGKDIFKYKSLVLGEASWIADRCRFHNATGSGWDDGDAATSVIKEIKVTNSFFYDIAEKPVYLKNFMGKTSILFQNNTYWNIGQQFDYINWYDNEADPITTATDATIVYDHCTAANVATGGEKEWMGNGLATDGSRPPINIVVKNCIFAYQGTDPATPPDPDFSIKGGISTGGVGDGVFDIMNICAWELHPVHPDFTGVVANWFEADPMFADTAARDYTIGSSDAAILYGADDGTILGAVYWGPAGVSVNDVKSELGLSCYPNPTSGTVKISYAVPATGNVNVTILNMVGQEVRTLVNSRMPAGNHEVSLDTRSMSKGIYLCRAGVDGNYETQKLVVK